MDVNAVCDDVGIYVLSTVQIFSLQTCNGLNAMLDKRMGDHDWETLSQGVVTLKSSSCKFTLFLELSGSNIERLTMKTDASKRVAR